MQVLLVEDTVAAAMAARLSLEHLQCAVTVVESAAEAIEKASTEDYDLIFMEVNLPDINGIEVTRRIRGLSDTKKSQVPIVALIDHVSEDQHDACLSAGMNDILTKPAQPLALKSAIQQWVLHQDNIDINSTSALPAIDWQGCLAACMGNEKVARELLSLVAEDLKKSQRKLAEAYTKKDIVALCDELHRCLGGIVYLRLPQLEEALKVFQEAVKAKPQDAQQLEVAYAELQTAMQVFWKAFDEMAV